MRTLPGSFSIIVGYAPRTGQEKVRDAYPTWLTCPTRCANPPYRGAELCGPERYDIRFRQRCCVQALENSVEGANRHRCRRRDLDADGFS